jgi:hypothetical protein
MYIKFLKNEIAKKFVCEHEKFKDLLKLLYITEWLEEENVKLCLLYNDEKILQSFVLLSKMDRDPLKTHIYPHHLNYIYTFEEFRRMGNACFLVSELKNTENITVFCTDDITNNLFKKAGYIFNSVDPLYKVLPIYRYP